MRDIAYVYAVALHSGGQRDEAMAVLKEALKKPSQRPRHSVGAGLVQPHSGGCSRSARLRRATRGHRAGRPKSGGIVLELRRAIKPSAQ